MARKKLYEICKNITDGTHSTVMDDNNSNNYLLSCKNIKDGAIIISSTDRRINNDTLLSLRKRTNMEYNDVLLTSVGTIGESAIVNVVNPNFEFQRSVAILKPNKHFVLSKYLHYFLISPVGKKIIYENIKGAAQPCLFLTDIKNIEINIPPIVIQQHIVNTIGSVDDLIENSNKIIDNLYKLGLIKINELNKKKELFNLTSITKLEKGNELGSSNYKNYYSDNFINYIRVGDLISLTNTYVEQKICNKFVNEDDILIAMDGAPGRNTIGLKGTYSSSLYKALCNKDKKGLVFFELNSDYNQSVIKNMSQGTTILHASKSIPFLKTILVNEKENEMFKNIYDEMVLLKKKVSLLKNIKEKLLIKYFTNQ